MSEEIHARIVNFLRTEFARMEGRACARIDLVHAPQGQRPDPIRPWDRKESPELFEDLSSIETLSSEILQIALEHAETFGSGNHRYEIKTTQVLGGRAKVGFRIRVEGDEGDLGDDPPTERGLVGQLMRHNESNARLMAQMHQVTIRTMTDAIRDLSDDNRRMTIDRRSHLRELEEARSEQAERDLEGMAQVAADKRKDEAFRKVMDLLPVLSSRLLGGGKKEDGANPAGAMAILATELAGSFTEEQRQKLFLLLNDSQKILLVELVNSASKHVPASPASGDQAGHDSPNGTHRSQS